MKKIITLLILAMTISIQAEGFVNQDTTSTKITNKIPIGKVIREPKSNYQRMKESLAGGQEEANRLANINQPKPTFEDDKQMFSNSKDAESIIVIIILAALLMFALHKASKHLTVK